MVEATGLGALVFEESEKHFKRRAMPPLWIFLAYCVGAVGLVLLIAFSIKARPFLYWSALISVASPLVFLLYNEYWDRYLAVRFRVLEQGVVLPYRTRGRGLVGGERDCLYYRELVAYSIVQDPDPRKVVLICGPREHYPISQAHVGAEAFGHLLTVLQPWLAELPGPEAVRKRGVPDDNGPTS